MEDNVSISIDLCFEKKALLSIPTMDALRVRHAFHSIVKWSFGSLQHMHDMQHKRMLEGNEVVAIQEAQLDGVNYREV